MRQTHIGQHRFPPGDIGRPCKSKRSRICYRRWTKKSNTWGISEPPAPPEYNVEWVLRGALEGQNKSNPIRAGACCQHCVGGKGGSRASAVWHTGVRFYCPSTVAPRLKNTRCRTPHGPRRGACQCGMCGTTIYHRCRGSQPDLHNMFWKTRYYI